MGEERHERWASGEGRRAVGVGSLRERGGVGVGPQGKGKRLSGSRASGQSIGIASEGGGRAMARSIFMMVKV